MQEVRNINSSSTEHEHQLQQKRRKILMLLCSHIQNFQKTLLNSRRRCQQRAKRRQAMLRAFYMQQMMELQSNYMSFMAEPELGLFASDDEQELEVKCEYEEPEDANTDADAAEQQTLHISSEFEPQFEESQSMQENDEPFLGFSSDEIAMQQLQEISKMMKHRELKPYVCTEFSNEAEQSAEQDDLSKPNFRNLKSLSQQQFLNNFRVSSSTFQWLCIKLYKAYNTTNSVPNCFKNVIPYEKRIALSLYAFATGEDLRVVADNFGVSRPTVSKYVKRFAEVMLEQFGDKIVFPDNQAEIQKMQLGFSKASNMPANMVMGILDRVAIPGGISNRDIAYRTFLQVVIDPNNRFRTISVGTYAPTMMLNDYKALGQIPYRILGNNKIHCFLAAASDSCYALRPWLMLPYANPQQPHEHDFNEAMSNLMLLRDRALRRFFARWNILQCKSESIESIIRLLTTACCILHNILEERNENYREEWEQQLPDTLKNFNPNMLKAEELLDNTKALKIRDFLAKTISSTEN